MKHSSKNVKAISSYTDVFCISEQNEESVEKENIAYSTKIYQNGSDRFLGTPTTKYKYGK